MQPTQKILTLLDEYDAAWNELYGSNDVVAGKVQSKENFRPLFLRVADLSFKLIELYQQHKGTHAIPVTARKDNRLDTDAIRTELTKILTDA